MCSIQFKDENSACSMIPLHREKDDPMSETGEIARDTRKTEDFNERTNSDAIVHGEFGGNYSPILTCVSM